MVEHSAGGCGSISLKRGRLFTGAYESARVPCDTVAQSVSNICVVFPIPYL